MATASRWILPCYFTEEDYSIKPISFEITAHLKKILQNEVWNRKYHYGFDVALRNTSIEDIAKATITIHPRFIQGMVDETRITKIITDSCGNIPEHFEVGTYKNWNDQVGVVIIETEYQSELEQIPGDARLHGNQFPRLEMEFIETYNRHLAVLKEISAFFLTVIHLTFPSQSVMMHDENPLVDGFFQITSKGNMYCKKITSNAYMHSILIETSKMSFIINNLDAISSVWHLNLWPLKRYLTAVETDQLSMDHMLDLIYALEGLFEKNTSSDFIKIMCIKSLCADRKKAKSMKNLLDVAYRIRNDIAHGERSYDSFDYVKIGGKNVLAQMIYWELKSIVANVIILGISKLLKNQEMKNLRFVEDDLINMIF